MDISREEQRVLHALAQGGAIHATKSPSGKVLTVECLNRDGWLDLVVGASSTDPTDPTRKGIPIFWGSPPGYTTHHRTILSPTPAFTTCTLTTTPRRSQMLRRR